MQDECPIPLTTAKTMPCSACKKTFALQDIAPFSRVFCSFCGSQQEAAGQLGSYLVLGLLGRGGMGAVFRGLDPALDRTVAIKVLSASSATGPHALDQFRREAKAAAQISHVNVARIFAFGIEQGQPYIVMEFVRGQSLMGHIDDHGPLEVSFALHVATQATEGLAAAAANALVHGDVKPENILVDSTDTAKLIDFGLASLANQPGSREIWGTPYYISPERLTPGHQIDFRSDLYSLGGTIYHALTGRPPFEGASAAEIAKARLKAMPPPPEQLRPGLDPDVSGIVMRALQREPASRYPSYNSMIGDMRRTSERLGAYSRQKKRSGLLVSARRTSSIPPPRTESRKPSPFGRFLLAGVAILAFGGALLLSFNRPKQNPPIQPLNNVTPTTTLETVPVTPPVNQSQPATAPNASIAPVPAVPESRVLLFALRDEVTTEPNTEVLIDVLANDTHPGGMAPQIVEVTDPSHGKVKITPKGKVSYRPTPNYKGTDTFNYSIRHSSGKTAKSSVTVTVADKPPPPPPVVNTAPVDSPQVAAIPAGGASKDTPPATSIVAAITEQEPPWPSNPIKADFTAEDLSTYAQGTSGKAKGSDIVLDNGRKIRLMGQTWKALPIRYEVTSNTVLECVFSSTRQGGVHAIGLDNQRKGMKEQMMFQLYGSNPSRANREYMNYSRFAPAERGYRIPIGRYYTGRFSFLVVGSSDGTQSGDSTFRDVVLHEVTNSPTAAASAKPPRR